jgi:hypothetical protein
MSYIKSVGKWVSQKIMIDDIGDIKSVGRWVSQNIIIDDISHIKSICKCVSQKIMINDNSHITLWLNVTNVIYQYFWLTHLLIDLMWLMSSITIYRLT